MVIQPLKNEKQRRLWSFWVRGALHEFNHNLKVSLLRLSSFDFFEKILPRRKILQLIQNPKDRPRYGFWLLKIVGYFRFISDISFCFERSFRIDTWVALIKKGEFANDVDSFVERYEERYFGKKNISTYFMHSLHVYYLIYCFDWLSLFKSLIWLNEKNQS